MSDTHIVTPETETPEPDTTTPEAYEAEAPEVEEVEEEVEASEPEAEVEEPTPPRQIEQNGQKYVTLSALQEERSRRREAEERAERRLAQIEERFLKAQREPEQPQDNQWDIPDPNEDVIGAVDALRRTTLAERQERERQMELYNQSQQETQLQDEVRRRSITQVEEYKKEHPEYDSAFQHLRQSRVSFYENLGYSPADINQVLAQEEFNIAHQLVANERSVPEAVIGLARAAGWQPPSQQEGVDKVKRVAQGQKQAKTLSGGGAPESEKNLKWMAALSDDEFRALPDEDFRRIMEGG